LETLAKKCATSRTRAKVGRAVLQIVKPEGDKPVVPRGPRIEIAKSETVAEFIRRDAWRRGPAGAI
jgi:hypothetical protein